MCLIYLVPAALFHGLASYTVALALVMIFVIWLSKAVLAEVKMRKERAQ